jgi:hypothetical protein
VYRPVQGDIGDVAFFGNLLSVLGGEFYFTLQYMKALPDGRMLMRPGPASGRYEHIDYGIGAISFFTGDHYSVGISGYRKAGAIIRYRSICLHR